VDRLWLFDRVAFVVLMLGTLAAYPFLRSRVPIHWSPGHGADAWMARETAVLVMPIVGLTTYAITHATVRLEAEPKTWLRTAVVVIFLALQAAIITGGLVSHD
jgi:uncharacterized membrane protein